MSLFMIMAKAIGCAAVFFGYYWFFLRNRNFHQYNRFYLLFSLLTSAIIPFLSIPFGLKGLNNGDSAIFRAMDVINVNTWENEVEGLTETAGQWFISAPTLAVIAYFLVALFFFLRFIFTFISIQKIKSRYSYRLVGRFRLYLTGEKGTPFSFFKTIFWNRSIDPDTAEGKAILAHELYHVTQRHSWDILFVEILRSIFWVNPFFHLMKKELRAIHEFLADNHAAQQAERNKYAELLISEAIRIRKLSIVNPFFHNQIKRRISMIVSNDMKSKNSLMGRAMILPIVLALFCSFTLKLHDARIPAPLRSEKKLILVIDAGHGGADNGAVNENGVPEKGLTLDIARKVKEISGRYNVDVIMTRENDELPGGAETVNSGLKNRVSTATQHTGDMLISIHMAIDPSNTNTSGFEIYVSKGNPAYAKSVMLGGMLSESLKKTWKTASALKQREKIYVLTASPMPALILEAGYLSNPTDLAFVSDPENQKKIAENILEAAVR
ncbi:MAG: N-acetylmuramoyl-L-alanine amidase, partial [Gemmatimonadaceae bacterium]|nr:N-acetylmuramoyl-L-alanine amidase [Chitinophagaceae bacterium]